MKYYPNTVNVTEVVEHFSPNGTTDGIQVFNEKGRPVGYLTDLKIKFCQKSNAKVKAKASQKLRAAERKEIISDLVEEMILFLRSELRVGDVFVNETMPNVDVNGERFYVIIGNSLDSSIRLNIRHKEFVADDFNDILVGGYTAKCHDETDIHNVMFSSLSKEDVAFIINQLADKI
ncbi:inhibitor of host transcription [Cronobacter phage S13]|uniref:inhibitor of host transcription n=1 Tax=Cronobacter phage S13 TaxID=1327935 RepID=UPI000499F1D1|nr:inhibitor of host transcription [Cronobacter phage S13]AIA64827.1 putative host transcription inhibitor [Cronobacter phage S13]